MADYTPEQIEALAEFARVSADKSVTFVETFTAGVRLGIFKPNGDMADWLRPEDWAGRAAAEAWPYGTPADRVRLAAIIRRHAEDRT